MRVADEDLAAAAHGLLSGQVACLLGCSERVALGASGSAQHSTVLDTCQGVSDDFPGSFHARVMPRSARAWRGYMAWRRRAAATLVTPCWRSRWSAVLRPAARWAG